MEKIGKVFEYYYIYIYIHFDIEEEKRVFEANRIIEIVVS